MGTVVAKLSGPGQIELAGDDTTRDTRIDGPHSCSVHESGEVTEVAGDVGEDALVVFPAQAHLDVEANSAEALVRGVRGTLRALFNVGHARVEGVLTYGESEIEANVGVLDIALQRDSDVRVAVRCAAHIDASGLRKVGRGEWAVGAGAGTLQITGTPGSVSLRVE